MSGKIKLGCINFINSLPLIYPLKSGLMPHPFELHFDVPFALVAKLQSGELDVALASTGALLNLGQDFSYIPGIGICSDGPVQTVVIRYAGNINSLTQIYPDQASVTGNLLSKIILDKQYNIHPYFLPVDKRTVNIDSLKEGEGCVLIGDKALRTKCHADEQIDLGAAWQELTGLPFIYALWIGRREFITDEVRIPLYNSFLVGSSMIPEIVGSLRHPTLHQDELIDYLENSIIYEVAERAEAGLEYFLKLAEEYI